MQSYEVDPLTCPHCGGEMRFLAVIEELPIIERILRHVRRGILEAAAEWDDEEIEPELVKARSRTVILMDRSGHRSVLAAHNLKRMGCQDVWSLKTGLRGWSDYELPLVDEAGDPVYQDGADNYFAISCCPISASLQETDHADL